MCTEKEGAGYKMSKVDFYEPFSGYSMNSITAYDIKKPYGGN